MFRKTITILSIDGGGTRGLIPALLLREFEERMGKKPHNWPDLFDLMAGSSTGGLISLGLACPGDKPPIPKYAANDLVDVYQNRGKEIFPVGSFKTLRTMGQAFTEKYDDKGFKKLLQEYFGESTLDECLTSLLITSYDVNRGKPHFFKYQKGKPHSNMNFRLSDIARATCSAPTYFEPAEISPIEEQNRKYCLVDGGLVANNPAQCAYTEARKLYPRAKKFIILSLGTGENPRRYSCKDMKHWGYLDWVSPTKDVPLMSEVSRAQSAAVDHMLGQTPGVTYHRLEVPLVRGIDMDDARSASLKVLEEGVKDFIETSGPRIEAAMRDILKARRKK